MLHLYSKKSLNSSYTNAENSLQKNRRFADYVMAKNSEKKSARI
nr:MAG TPA: hypothetical protein [Inoviridae sp.]